MTRRNPALLAGRPGWVFALLAGWLLLPGTARAGCGDHLRPGPAPEHPARPCTGPLCQRLPDLPAPAPTSLPRLPERSSALLAAALVLPDTLPTLFDTRSTSARRIHRTTLIYHPPRPGR
jgi:hypothetical protein